MLSRIAESLFWIGRYVERADDTARILEVHFQTMLEDPWLEEDLACRSLFAVMGVEAPVIGSTVTREETFEALCLSSEISGSIYSCIDAARRNAKQARETISSELWESLNTTWNSFPTTVSEVGLNNFFSWIRERSAMVDGVAYATLSRDEGWNFLVLGRNIERADMMARLISSRALAPSKGPNWHTLLRSAGGFEAYLRAYRGVTTDSRASEFLLLDRLFPRSIVHALSTAEQCLENLEPSGLTRVRISDRARQYIGTVRTQLEYRPLLETLEDLPQEMERVQRACSRASKAIADRYFPSDVSTTWVGETV